MITVAIINSPSAGEIVTQSLPVTWMMFRIIPKEIWFMLGGFLIFAIIIKRWERKRERKQLADDIAEGIRRSKR